MNQCMMPCGDMVTKRVLASIPEDCETSQSQKSSATTKEDRTTIVETFEMILQEPAVAPKRKRFWPFRRRRGQSKATKSGTPHAHLNVVATESRVSEHDEEGEESISMELVPESDMAVTTTQDIVQDDESEEDGPPLRPISGELVLFESDMKQEEEKKDDDVDAAAVHYPTPPAATRYSRKVHKDARYKQLLGGLLSNRLTPVTEEEPANDAEAYVRVPGLSHPDKFLSSNDLIGEEYCSHEKLTTVQNVTEDNLFSDEEDSDIDSETYGDETETGPFSTSVDETNTQFESTDGTTTKASSVMSKSISPRMVTEAPKPIEEPRPVVTKPSRIWLLSCQNQDVASAVITEDKAHKSIPTASSTTRSATAKPASAKRPVWKPATCPLSGRPYWYHRDTRETTWVQPVDEDIVSAKPKVPAVGKIEKAETFIEEKKEETLAEVKAAPSDELPAVPEAKPKQVVRSRTPVVQQSKPKDIVRPKTPVIPELKPKEVVRTSTPDREYERKVSAVKDDIISMLKTMAPPDGQDVNLLLAQYDGKEEQLLVHLLNESKPFDEPVEKGAATPETTVRRVKPPLIPKSAAPALTAAPKPAALLPVPISRVQTHTTHTSTHSCVTESTVQIKNTFNPNKKKRSEFETGSISSARQQLLQQRSRDSELHDEMSAKPPVDKVPSNIMPVPRLRELVAEEFNTTGPKAEVFDTKAASRRPFARLANPRSPSPPAASFSDGKLTPVNYLGDTEADADTHDTSSLPNDSISALSEVDYLLDHPTKDPEAARRRALDDAIAREDWDLAAVLSEGMTKFSSSKRSGSGSKTEWAQTELDRFISENNWDAVAKYISSVRAVDPEESVPVRHVDAPEHNPRKRFGARSQLQHKGGGHEDVQSLESWESGGSVSSFDSDEYSASLESVSSSDESESLHRRRRSQKRSTSRRRR